MENYKDTLKFSCLELEISCKCNLCLSRLYIDKNMDLPIYHAHRHLCDSLTDCHQLEPVSLFYELCVMVLS